MSSTHVVPSSVAAMGNLLQRQGEHLTGLGGDANDCASTKGLDGMLAPLQKPVTTLGNFTATTYLKCGSTLEIDHHEVLNAADDYRSADNSNAEALSAAFDSVPKFFKQDGIGGSPHGFNDVEAPKWGPPERKDLADAAEEDLDGRIAKLRAGEGGEAGEGGDSKKGNKLDVLSETLGAVEWAWEKVGKQDDLTQTLITPLTGDYWQLSYLAKTYEHLGEETYKVGWNIRSGQYNLAPDWAGAAAGRFHWYAFRWHMGLGGLGDACQVVGGLFTKGYELIIEALARVFDGIMWFADKILYKIAMHFVGWGKFNPKSWWDLIDAGWDLVTKGVEKFEQIKADIEKLHKTVKDVAAKLVKQHKEIVDAVESGRATAKLYEDCTKPQAENEEADKSNFDKYNQFESMKGWDHELGSARVAMLPELKSMTSSVDEMMRSGGTSGYPPGSGGPVGGY